MVALTSGPATAADNHNVPSINDLSSILETLTACLNSASTSLPSAIEPEEKPSSSNPTILPPADGISLLDTKAELLLSYMQNLIFLVLFQLRARGKNDNNQGGVSKDDIVRKLTELRVYIDKGVKPLEGRLKYQIDKVVKAAEDAEWATKSASKTGKKTKRENSEELSEGDERDSAESDEDNDEEESDDDNEDEDEQIDEMAYRPNITAFSKNLQQKSENEAKTTSSKDRKDQSSDGIYRPPRIKPTALPTTDSRDRARERERRPKKSSVIDEFVSAELSSAPMAQPSIGSTIQRGGRGVLTQRDREREAERRAYEETNFVRLPKESKKERAKRRAQEGPGTGGFGGEEFRLLREGADRIGRLTKRAAGSSSRDGALEKSRKRAFTEDGPRGDGTAVGQLFEKRRKKVEGWKK